MVLKKTKVYIKSPVRGSVHDNCIVALNTFASADTPEFYQTLHKYRMNASWVMKRSEFGDYSYIAGNLLDRLDEFGIDVRCSLDGFLDSEMGNYMGSTILIDMSKHRAQNPIELLDTLCHEAVHSTGNELRRWQNNKQPEDRSSEEYIVEECVAKIGSIMLIEKLKKVNHYKTNVFMQQQEIDRKHQGLVEHAEKKAVAAASFLLHVAKKRATVRRRFREAFGKTIYDLFPYYSY